MIHVKVEGVPGFDGAYDWDETVPFNGHELHLIKQVAGVRLGEISEALGAGDYDVIVAVTAITIWRDGRVTKEQVSSLVEMLLDAEGGKIVFEEAAASEEADDDRPPASALLSGNASSNDEPSATPDSSPTSSDASRSTGDDPPATPPSFTGGLGLVGDAASA